MSEPVKRYGFVPAYGGGRRERRDDGNFVLFSDHERAMAEKDEAHTIEIDGLKTKLATLHANYDQVGRDRNEYQARYCLQLQLRQDDELATNMKRNELEKRLDKAHVDLKDAGKDVWQAKADRDKAEADLAALKARCEGMREDKLRQKLEALPKCRIEGLMTDAQGNARWIVAIEDVLAALSSLPVEGLVERVAKWIVDDQYGGDSQEVSPEWAFVKAAELIRMIGGTK